MKILIIRFSSIGDIVLTTPVVRCLKLQTGAEIHYLTKRSFEKILTSNPHIDRVFTIEKEVSEVMTDLKSMQYDYVIDLHKNLRTMQVKWALGVKNLSFEKLNFEKWLMVCFKINRLPNTHIVDRYLRTVASLGVKNDGFGLDYFIPKTDEISIADLGIKPQNTEGVIQYIAFVIGAAHKTKRLPIDKIIEICNQIKLPVVLLGGKDDISNSELIITKSTSNVYDFCGKLNLNQSASVVKQAHKVITHDTGLMHIAAAFHKDIITIWGNTIPEFGMTAYTENVENFEVKDLPCRPCSKIGHHECPKGHFKCMNGQNTEGVILYANK